MSAFLQAAPQQLQIHPVPACSAGGDLQLDVGLLQLCCTSLEGFGRGLDADQGRVLRLLGQLEHAGLQSLGCQGECVNLHHSPGSGGSHVLLKPARAGMQILAIVPAGSGTCECTSAGRVRGDSLPNPEKEQEQAGRGWPGRAWCQQ